MDANQRLKLQEMITENNVVDNTHMIRMCKHSQKIRDDVTTLAMLTRDYGRLDRGKFEALCASRCAFLFERYPELYNKLMRHEIDTAILDKVLVSLKRVEDSELDQHEASFEVGTLLRKMYVDSALRNQRAREAKDTERARHGATPVSNQAYATWREFKRAKS